MFQEIFTGTTGVLPTLGWAVGFYFSSALLVLVALLPVVGKLFHLLAQGKLALMPVRLVAGVLTFLAKIMVVISMLVVGGSLTWQEVGKEQAWLALLQDLGVVLSIDGLLIGLQLAVIGVLWMLCGLLLTVIFSEARTAKIVTRMQRSWAPAKVQIVFVYGVTGLLVAPIMVAACLKILRLV